MRSQPDYWEILFHVWAAATTSACCVSLRDATSPHPQSASIAQMVMDDSQPPASATYAVSRTRGKQAGEFLLSTKLRDRRTVKGQARSSEESESEDEIGPGLSLQYIPGQPSLLNCLSRLRGSAQVVQLQSRLPSRQYCGQLWEMYSYGRSGGAQSRQLGWPPSCSCLRTTPDGQGRIRMGYIQGQRPDALWPDMSAEHKKDVARQLRARPERMRSVAPPKLIGACDGTEIRDTSQHFTYHSPLCRDEETSNEIILSPLTNTYPHSCEKPSLGGCAQIIALSFPMATSRPEISRSKTGK